MNRAWGWFVVGLLAISVAPVLSSPASGQDAPAASPPKGQQTLDEATDLKLDAQTPDQLARVIELGEKAIAEGLEEEDVQVAKQLIAAASLQRAELYYNQIVQSRAQNPTILRRLRGNILKDLQRAIENDSTLAEAYLMLAKVEEPPKGLEAIKKGIELLKDRPTELAQALLVLAALAPTPEEKLAALDRAIEADSSNLEAWQARIGLLVATGKFDLAYEGAKTFLDQQPDNLFAIQAAVAALKELDRTDDAIALLTEKIESLSDPSPLYRVRAEMYMEKEKADEALADLTKAVEAEPRDLQSLLMRAQVHLQKDDFDKAEEDIEDILALQPNSPGALYFRSLIAANQKRMDEAIDDLQKLVRIVPDNIQFLLQLASFYQMDDRPNKAIELADEILKADKPEWKELTHRVYRLRGDARLSIGKHVEAIADFEKAIELVPAEEKESRSGLLNNLAWVLATSPKDEIRNGKRSVELGTEACELTEFKEAHILSTLAAGYAEIGNFEEAIKWSTKAVELGSQEKAEQLDQLRKELESYQQNKPWREQQDVQEKKAPIVPSADGVDT